MNEELELLRDKKGFICDMDGVIYHGNRLLPGVPEFVDWLQRENKSFLFLTNSSERSPLELQQKLARMGLEIGEEHFYTSALATAKFIASQKPHASAYVIGAPGLVGALYEAGIVMNDVDPDYVIAGETNTYNYQTILKAELGYANILMDTASGTVTVDGNSINLRPKEAKILELLLREQGRTVSRDLLIERVWGTDFDGDERMIDRHIASLRKALGTASQHIRAVYGKGYRLGGST